MTFEEIVRKNRSYRRFYEDEVISLRTLKTLVDLARTTPNAANKQVLKYKIVNDPTLNAAVFEQLAWAGYLRDWAGPVEGERPSAYIILITDLSLGKDHKQDEGIVAQTIMLGATSMGLGGCMLGAIKRDNLYRILNIDNEQYEINLVLALGKPKEEVVIEEIKDDNVKYYRDENQVHHVPKRTLEEVLL